MTDSRIFDTHTHMNDDCFDAERLALLRDFPKKQIGAFTEVGYDLESSRRAVRLAEELAEKNQERGEAEYPEGYAAIGFHPDHVDALREPELEALRELARSKHVVAIGEIGLDYYYIDRRSPEEKEEALRAKARLQELLQDFFGTGSEVPTADWKPSGEDWGRLGIGQKEYKRLKRLSETVDFSYDPVPEVQKAAFVRQMELAKELQLPIVIHSREAAQDTYELVMEHHGYENGGIVHCFSYSVEMAEQFVKQGMYLGVGGVLTFPNGRRLKEVAARIPLSSLVLETDCPYMAPVPLRGQRNDSRNLHYVVAELARIKGVSEAEVIRVTTENARRVYRIETVGNP